MDAVADWIRGGRELIVVGGGVGGVLANLCAVDMALRYPECKVLLHTFGTPRVFASDSADAIQECLVTHGGGTKPAVRPAARQLGKPGRIFAQRWLTTGDGMPDLVQPGCGLKHVGHGLLIRTAGFRRGIICTLEAQDFAPEALGSGWGCCVGAAASRAHSPAEYARRMDVNRNRICKPKARRPAGNKVAPAQPTVTDGQHMDAKQFPLVEATPGSHVRMSCLEDGYTVEHHLAPVDE